MATFHVYVRHRMENKDQPTVLLYDNSREFVEQRIAAPYMNNETLMIGGRFVHSSDIEEILIFWSVERAGKTILPNGKTMLDESLDYIKRCYADGTLEGLSLCTDDFITSPPKEEPTKEPSELTINLMESASFLGLDEDWSLASRALQLQEVAVAFVAKRKGIPLDKADVERMLNKKIESVTFNDKYEAFCIQVKDAFRIEMPILTAHLTEMRAKVLQDAYNPQPRETESIVNFTVGLLQKLKNISEAT